MPVSDDSGLRRAMTVAKTNKFNIIGHLTGNVGVPILLLYIWSNTVPGAVERRLVAAEARASKQEDTVTTIRIEQTAVNSQLSAKLDALLHQQGIPIPAKPVVKTTVKVTVPPESTVTPWMSGDTVFIPVSDSSVTDTSGSN